MLAGRTDLGARYAHVDRDGQAQLGAGGVDRVVELVVERVLLHQRRDPDQGHGRVVRQITEAGALADRSVGPVDDQGDAEPLGVGGDVIEQRARSRARRSRRRPRRWSTSHLSMVAMSLPSVEAAERSPPSRSVMCSLPGRAVKSLAPLSLSALTQRSTVGDLPSDVEVMSSSIEVGAGDRQGAGWAFLARAARRSWTPLVSESLISWSLSLEMKRWTRFSNRNRRMGLKAW